MVIRLIYGDWSLSHYSLVSTTFISGQDNYTLQSYNKVLHSPRPGFLQLDLRPKNVIIIKKTLLFCFNIIFFLVISSFKLIKDFNMSVYFDSAKSSIKDALHDESKPWCKFFSWAEAQTGVSRLNLFIGKKFKIKSFVLFYLTK